MSWGYSNNIHNSFHPEQYFEQGTDDHSKEFLDVSKIDPLDPYFSRSHSKGLFHGKHSYTIAAAAVKIFEEDQYKKTLIHLLLKKIINNLDIMSVIWGFAEIGNAQYEGFYRAGQEYFKKYLPTTRFLTSKSVDLNKVQKIIEAKVNSKININTSNNSVISYPQLVYYSLQEVYDYNIGTDILYYQGKYYYLDDMKSTTVESGYEKSINVIFKSFKEIVTIKHKEIIIDIKNKNETTDIKTETSTLITEVLRKDTGYLVYTKKDIPVITTTEITKGSETPQTKYEFISEEVSTPTPESTNIIVSLKDLDKNYLLVNYTKLTNNRVYYWLYDYSSNIYPELNNNIGDTIGYETYPIVTFKNNFSDISGKQREDTDLLLKPLNISTKTILDAVAQNPNYDKIRDVYMVLGVSPADLDPIVSTILYGMMEYFYKHTSVITGSRYSIYNTTRGNSYPYETNMSWIGLPPVEREEHICPLGECRHQYVENYFGTYAYATGEVINGIVTVKAYMEVKTSDNIIISNKCEQVLTADINKANVYESYNAPSYDESYKTIKVRPSGVGYKAEVGEIILGSIPGTSFDYDYFVSYNTYHGGGDHERWVTEYYKYIKTPAFTVYNDGTIQSTSHRFIRNKISQDIEILKQVTKNKTRTYILSDFYGTCITPYPKGTAVITLNGANKELVIPIPVQVVKSLSLQEQTKALDNILHLQMYAYDHQHTKWYHTGFFGFVLSTVALVISAVTFNPSTFIASISWTTVLTAGAILLAVTLIFKFVENPFLKVLLSVAAQLTLGYVGGFYDTGFGFMDAVALGETAIKAVDIYTGDQFKALNKERQSFLTEYEARQDEFQKHFDSFNKSYLQVEDVTDIATFTDVASTEYRAMSPTTFYYQATEAYKDFDILFSMPEIAVNSFTDNLLKLNYD